MIVKTFVTRRIGISALHRIGKEIEHFQRDLRGLLPGDPLSLNPNGKAGDPKAGGRDTGRRPAGRAVLYDSPFRMVFIQEEQKSLLLNRLKHELFFRP